MAINVTQTSRQTDAHIHTGDTLLLPSYTKVVECTTHEWRYLHDFVFHGHGAVDVEAGVHLLGFALGARLGLQPRRRTER